VSTKAHASSRLAFIDVLRGVGVVLMIQLHTSHGWVQLESRSGGIWQAAQFWGGLAAPIFLTLAGVSLGLRFARAHARGQVPSYGDELRRALQLVVLGYLLRLQMWFIDAGGFARTEAYAAQALLLLAYATAYFTLGHARWRSLPMAAGLGTAAALFAAGYWQTAVSAPDRLLGITRVDVLQCIGGSLAIVIGVAALHGRSFRLRSFYVVAALAVAFLASWTRGWVPGPLPAPIAAYLGQWPAEPGKSIVGLFPLFPWSAYALAGTAFGLVWARTPPHLLPRRTAWIAIIALCVALITRETFAHEVLSQFPWLTQPLRVTQRVAWVIALAGACAATRALLPAVVAPLETLGRASLLVYWIHLEFAFGAASSGFAKSLGLTPWAVGTLGLVLAMWLVAQIRLGLGSRPHYSLSPPEEPSAPRERTRSAPG
jgi:uncharacterized membrane protein